MVTPILDSESLVKVIIQASANDYDRIVSIPVWKSLGILKQYCVILDVL